VLIAGAGLAADPISWEDAEKHVGEDVVVEGRVLGIHCSPTSCLLAFDPSFNRFTAVVQAESFKTLPPQMLESTFVGRKVRVHGTVKLLEKKPEIIVGSPEDIQLVVTEQDKKAETDAAQADVLDRMEALMDRIEQVASRLESNQERLEQLAQVLDQRLAQVAALNQSFAPPPPPPEPSYGEPQPRPAFEALRTVKRGMTADQVARLIGQPVGVEQGSEGAYTWYYGYGRQIMFDARNRATSLSGFPNP